MISARILIFALTDHIFSTICRMPYRPYLPLQFAGCLTDHIFPYNLQDALQTISSLTICRIPYRPYLPYNLCRCLDSTIPCANCGTVCCFQQCYEDYKYIDSLILWKVSRYFYIDRNRGSTAPIEVLFCSDQCLKLWQST